MLPGLERSGRSAAVFHASVIRATCGLPSQTKRRGNNASVTDKDAETAKIVQKKKKKKKKKKKTRKRMRKDKYVISLSYVLISKIVF